MSKKRPRYNWDRLKAEYLEGDYLTVREFLRAKKIPLSNQFNKSTRGWIDEKKKLEKEILLASTQKFLQTEVGDLTQVRLRQARLARFLQLKGVTGIKNTEPETIDEARRLIVSGLREERQALGVDSGMKQSLTQININPPKTNLDRMIEKLDYEGLLKLIAELKRERTRRTLPETSSSRPGEVEEGEIV